MVEYPSHTRRQEHSLGSKTIRVLVAGLLDFVRCIEHESSHKVCSHPGLSVGSKRPCSRSTVEADHCLHISRSQQKVLPQMHNFTGQDACRYTLQSIKSWKHLAAVEGQRLKLYWTAATAAGEKMLHVLIFWARFGGIHRGHGMLILQISPYSDLCSDPTCETSSRL